jgi:hypothetical protein
MANECISRSEILRNTLFHIQIKQCQYIDNFPEAVTSVLESAVGKKGLMDYEKVKRRLYRIRTNFFRINQGKTTKKSFFEGLYERIKNRT